jgi:1,4-alpha-glucan branching enzyme
MPASQDHIDARTPLGANLVPGGCTFRAWAPRAQAVSVRGPFNNWQQDDASLLVKDANGYWAGYVPGVADGTAYKFYVQGNGSAGYKRDPFARELTLDPPYPHSNCVVRSLGGYPWHDDNFRPPAFNDLVVYQFHIGVYYAVDAAGKDRRLHRGAKFLDVLDRIEYLADLGVNAIEPLPIVEFATAFGLGYNGTDYFAPEMAYAVPPDELPAYLDKANRLLVARNQDKLMAADLATQTGQLKALIDICHVYGLAVILDVVYNHAGGDFGDESLYFFDRAVFHSNNDSLYFTDQDWAGGLVFAYWNQDVRQFLIDNAHFFLEEYHVDGLRYDEVSVIDRFGGWRFCQDLTSTMRFSKPSAVQIAEFWNPDPSYAVRPPEAGGGGFDTVWVAGLRDAVRVVIGQASSGRGACVDLNPVRDNLYPLSGFPATWQAVQYLENHDLLLVTHSDQDKRPRMPALADPSNAHSWYARSRSRVATGLLLTAPGVPMLFMGEEFLEDKYWSDNPDDPNHLIYWDGLSRDKTMIDYLRFTRELLALRRRQPALRGERINVFHVHNDNRVLAFQRWLDEIGRDVVVVVSLNESTSYGYRVGFPSAGWWYEVFNSDVYDNWVNPIVAGNGTGVSADGDPMHGLPASASLVIPANGLLIFARDRGD